MLTHPISPVYDEHASILILGSFPSVKSREQGFFYGHPQNRFWRVTAAVFEDDVPMTVPDRRAFLLRHGIALWDSVQSCVRPGSLDQKIAAETPNDIPGFLRSHPSVRRVCFNGAAAQKFHDRYHTRLGEVEYLLLPSTSPIPRQKIKTLEDKLPFWQEALAAVLKRDG